MQDEIATRWLTREDVSAKTISYAQNGEDVLLDRVFGRGYEGFYVDVGANDPIFHSVTKLLYGHGWRGVNIEPTPVLHRRLSDDRPGDVNLNVGISDVEGTLTFHEVAPPLHGWSTFLPELAASYRDEHGVFPIERPIPVTTLNQVFEAHVDRTVDVLKVDAEGFERQVLSSLDWSKWRPRVVLIEDTWADLWHPILDGAEYDLAAFDGLNRYYVRSEDRALLPAFKSPVNILDNFISHEVVRLLEQEISKLAQIGSPTIPDSPGPAAELGPRLLSLAHRVQSVARRNPRLARVVGQILKRVG